MALRASKQEKYQEGWFFNLSYKTKFLYYYLNDRVDIAGFLIISFDHIIFETKLPLEDIQKSLKELEDNKIIIYSNNREIIWLTKFLEEQSNYPLNPLNNCHKGILQKIQGDLRLFVNDKEFFHNLQTFEVIDADGKLKKTGNIITLLEHSKTHGYL